MKKFLFLSAVIFLIDVNALFAQPFLDLTTIDHSVKPGDDFYLYANGNWLKSREIPATENSWGNWQIIGKQTRLRLLDLIEEISARKNSAGSNAQKLGDFYKSGMDTVVIEKLGIKPIATELSQIDDINNIQGVMNETIAQYATGLIQIPPLYGMVPVPDPIRNDMEIIAFGQDGMGLPEKSYYFDQDEKSVNIRYKYVGYLQQLLQLSGVAKEAAHAKSAAVLALETLLAKGARTATENRDIPRQLNYYTQEKLKQQFPLIAWDDIFRQLNIHSEKILVFQPEFFDTLNKELKAIPLHTWKDYLKIRLLSNAAPYLSTAFQKANFVFYKTVLSGQKQMKPRSEEMVTILDNMLGEVLGKLYVEKYFTANAKKRIDELVDNVLKTFGERIKSNTWMTDSTKEKALEKLSLVRKKIAYPDKWRDYSSLTIGNNYYENVKAASAFNFRYYINLVGKPVDRDIWGMTPPTLNAYYNALNNEIVFPAGILLPPFFDAAADDAVNYGGIGVVIGHEISHGFDDQGSLFDGGGHYKNWWTKTDKANFEARGEALAKQFDQYVALDTLHVNGRLTLGENIGDLCGVTVAYQAFKKTPEGKSNQMIDGLTSDQRFFLSYASIWREKERSEFLRTMTLTNPHSPARFRVNGPLSNLDAFYAAFNIKQGDKMWRPVNQRLVIW
jgi:putative endopeptidase